MHQPASETGHLIAQATAEQSDPSVTQLVTSSTRGGTQDRWASESSVSCSTQIPASVDITSYRNLPPASTETHNSDDRDYYRHERHRLLTFSGGWPSTSPVTPQDLAAAGMYYMGVEDIVRCAFCQVSLKHWTPGDSASTEHQKYSPQCPFIRGESVGNIPMETGIHRSTSFPIEFRQDMFEVCASPAHPEFSSSDARLRTYPFEKMPSGQSVNDMVKAGFIYGGPGDAVYCYWCGGSLKQWTKSDQPWSEHMRWFPHCGLIRQQSAKAANVSVQSAQTSNARVHQETSNNDNRSEAVFSNTPTAPGAGGLLPLLVQQMQIEEENEPTHPADAELNERKSSEGNAKQTNQPTANGGEAVSIAVGNETDDRGGMVTLMEENRRLKSALLCKICMDADVDTLFLPCGHLVCCSNCAASVKLCPMCRVDIRGSLRTYIA